MTGPLNGKRIVEFGGIGPGPFACMMLADHGAEVIRIERPGISEPRIADQLAKDVLLRSRRIIALDLRSEDGLAVAKDIVRTADGVVEGFRPGVMERLGLGPDALLEINPRLVYGRMTGWGQTGPYAPYAGHDINYIALSGALHATGRANEKPVPPLNLIGDFGGGGMMLAYSMVCALLHAERTGEGQAIDCAMVDGSSLLMSLIWSMRAWGRWKDERGVNLLDSGAFFYDVYETADGRFISVGAIEPQFYAELRAKAGFPREPEFDVHMNPASWPALKEKTAAIFRTKTRDEWCALLEHSDACFAPVMSLDEAPMHPHNRARQNFVEAGGVMQPAPAPRYSRNELVAPRMHSASEPAPLLQELGYDRERIADLIGRHVVE